MTKLRAYTVPLGCAAIAFFGLQSGVSAWEAGGVILGLTVYMLDKLERKVNALLDAAGLHVD